MPQYTYYSCPVCRKPLSHENGSFRCDKGHCFDVHKSGYVNLLLSSSMKSKHPGDNKQMVEMRNAFLSKGYYDELKLELCKLVVEFFPQKGILLDAGCGEGYYTSAMATAIQATKVRAIIGVDISKEALRVAAKRDKNESENIHFAAASVFDIPVRDYSVDMLTLLFAPFAEAELNRVIKRNGIFIMVVPGARHLFQLKQEVYEKPYENEVKSSELSGFKLIKKSSIKSSISLDNPSDIQSLFFMTPYAYKTSREDTERMLSLTSLTTGIEFELFVYRKI